MNTKLTFSVNFDRQRITKSMMTDRIIYSICLHLAPNKPVF